MRPLTLIVGFFTALAGQAQWDVPVRMVLDGGSAADRQVLGLAEPVALDAAVSVEAVRSGAVTFAQASGGALLRADLFPAPVSYTTGMLVCLVPSSATPPGVQVEINGLGPRPIVKMGGLPLDSADLFPGVPARLVYDGARFHLLNSTYLPCGRGFHVGGREFCIADSSRSALSFFDAIKTCRDMGARLCSYGEWVHSCLKDPAFIGTVLDYEWVDDAANNTGDAKRVGNGGDGVVGTPEGINCKHGGTTVPIDPHRFRCCTHR